MKRWGYWIIAVVAVLAMVALIGWAGAFVPPLVPSASEDWSRGRILGVMPVNVRVDARPAPDDGMFLSWVDPNDRLHVARLGTRGRVVSDRTLALRADVPREPQLLVGPGPENDIHLIWRETGDGRSLLTYARLNGAALVQAGPHLLSRAGDRVESPNIAFNHRGGVEVLWSGQAGIYWATLSAKGEVQGEPILLVEDGEAASVQADHEGILHLTWLQSMGTNIRAVYYASLDPERSSLSQPEEMTRLFLRAGQAVQSLVIGMDADTGYVLWVIQDMKYVTSSAQYAFFPLEIPRQKKVRDLQLDRGSNPSSLWAARGQYETLLVALTETIMTEDGPQLQVVVLTLRGEQMPGQQAWATVEGRRSWMIGPIALHAPLQIARYASNRQSRALNSEFAQPGWPEGQVIVTASDRPSLRPTLAVDAQNNLHLTWLETGGFQVYRVAYASTASGVKEAYNRLTVWDVTDRALGLAMQFFVAVGLTPVLVIYWSLAPLGWLLLYLLFSGREHLTTAGTWVALGVSVLLEVVSTYLYYPHRSRMPPALEPIAPLATAAVGLLPMMLYLRKRDEKSLFGAFFVFAIVHGLLQVICFVLVR